MVFNKKQLIICGIFILFLLNPSYAHAYVDPGIVGMLFQAVFTFIFGIMVVWIVAPFKYFRGRFDRFRAWLKSIGKRKG